jgi:hypothetical protein
MRFQIIVNLPMRKRMVHTLTAERYVRTDKMRLNSSNLLCRTTRPKRQDSFAKPAKPRRIFEVRMYVIK